MHILVTGASGFIGRRLVEKLTEQDTFTVYGLSRSPVPLNRPNYIPLAANIAKQDWVDLIPSTIEVVVHLAQSKRYRDFPAGVSDMVQININATLALLEWSQKNQVRKFLFASTGNVYKPSKTLLKETDRCEPDSMYAATKMSAEMLIQQYSVFFSTIIMRLFGIYGPSQKDMIMATLIERVTTDQEITLAQGVGFYLTPLYISDCIAMIERLLKLNSTSNEIFNLAGKEKLHLGEVVQLIAEVTQKTPKIKWTDESPRYLQGNNEKICKAIDYQPLIGLLEGIENIVGKLK